MVVRLKVSLTLEGPVLSRATEPGKPGLDSPVARDASGHPMLPFSLVQGRLLQAWREIGPAIGVEGPRLVELLGQPSDDENQDWNPRPGRLAFSDFVATDTGGNTLDTSVRLDPVRHAAEDGMLRHLEMPFLPGAEVVMEGEVRFLARDGSDAERVTRQVEQGLRWVPFYGSEHTVGFGRAKAVKVTAETVQAPEPREQTATGAEVLPLELRFKSPFCLAQRPEGGNLFEGGDVVPGGVVKGTLARMLQQLAGLSAGAEIAANLPAPFAALGRHFSALRFTHALPSLTSGPRPQPTPRSTVAVKVGKEPALFDVALLPGPALVHGKAPAFAVDWKTPEENAARRQFGWPEVERELRLRTAIDPNQRRAADEKLFGYSAVRPGALVWRGAVDMSAVPSGERPEVEKELRALLTLGLQGVGKTSAEAEVAVGEADSDSSQLEPLTDSQDKKVWVVTLLTPALLADSSRLKEGSGEQQLRAAYAASWEQMGKDAGLELLRWFTQERLVGGYQTQRFKKARGGDPKLETSYRPYLLSEAGSVFVLTAGDNKGAATLLGSWMRHGLPLPDWARDRYGDSWKTNPFTPQDGYGEIAVNLNCHRVPDVWEEA